MSNNVGYGDKLARGAVRATYPAAEAGISEDKWAKAFDDFDPEKYKNGTNSEQRADSDSDTNLSQSGDASADIGAAEREPITR